MLWQADVYFDVLSCCIDDKIGDFLDFNISRVLEFHVLMEKS